MKDESELPETNKDTGKPSSGKNPFVQAIETVKAKAIELNLQLPAYLINWITSTSWRLCKKGMVISLASHEAVLEAVLKNEKVIEFRQQLMKDDSALPETNMDRGKPLADESAPETNMDRGKPLADESVPETNKDTGKHPFVQAFETVKTKVTGYMERITEHCNPSFGVADKGLSDKDPEFVKAVKASWVLCIAAVILIVLVK